MSAPTDCPFRHRSQEAEAVLAYLLAFPNDGIAWWRRLVSPIVDAWNRWTGGGDHVYTLLELQRSARRAHQLVEDSRCELSDVDMPAYLRLRKVVDDFSKLNGFDEERAVNAVVLEIDRVRRRPEMEAQWRARLDPSRRAGGGRALLLFDPRIEPHQRGDAERVIAALGSAVCNAGRVLDFARWRLRLRTAGWALMSAGVGVAGFVLLKPSLSDKPPQPAVQGRIVSEPSVQRPARVDVGSPAGAQQIPAETPLKPTPISAPVVAEVTEGAADEARALQAFENDRRRCQDAGGSCRLDVSAVLGYLQHGVPAVRLAQAIRASGVRTIAEPGPLNQVRHLASMVADLIGPPSAPADRTLWMSYTDKLAMVWIAAGEFWMDRMEVTNEAFRNFVRADDSHLSAGFAPSAWEVQNRDFAPHDPAQNVPLAVAHDFCRWAGKSLPAWAQWEKAERASSSSPPGLLGMRDGVSEWVAVLPERPAYCGGHRGVDSVASGCTLYPDSGARVDLGFRCLYKPAPESNGL